MKTSQRRFVLRMQALALCACLNAGPCLGQPAEQPPNFPRLFGMNIGAKNYDDIAYQDALAKLDVVILAFYRGWRNDIAGEKIAPVVQRLKRINPKILVGQYTILNETGDNPADTPKADLLAKVTAEDWWARDAAGNRVQWTSVYNAWDLNFTATAPVDSAGKRYSQWLPERDYNVFFSKVPDFDIWYFDNVFARPRVTADWDGNGTDDLALDPAVGAAYRQGYVTEWQRARELAPSIIIMGNSDNDLNSPEFHGKLQGAFLECIMGRDSSLETRGGWQVMMSRYTAALANTVTPNIVVFHVCGLPDDYRLFRYGFASALMRDGYYSYTKDYSSVTWFDEYGVDLGQAIDAPPTEPDSQGIYRRSFDHGLVLLNPTTQAVTVKAPPGYRRILGTQDPLVNNGEIAGQVLLPAKDGILLVASDIVAPTKLRITK